MKPPLFVRPLTADEAAALRAAHRSPDAFTLRRAQILSASAVGHRPAQIAAALGCASQTVRDAIRAFHAEGVGCLAAKSKAPKAAHAAWPRERDADLRALLHQSPRAFGRPTSLWTLAGAARVCFERGWTARVLSGEAIRLVLKRLGVSWKRAKHWLTSPDPAYARKKSCGTA
jgi:transposase